MLRQQSDGLERQGQLQHVTLMCPLVASVFRLFHPPLDSFLILPCLHLLLSVKYLASYQAT